MYAIFEKMMERLGPDLPPSHIASGFALQASIFAFGYVVTSRRYKTVGQAHSQVLVYSLIKNI
jgi:hypothetical protein